MNNDQFKIQKRRTGDGEDEDEYEHIDGGQQRGKGQGARDVMEQKRQQNHGTHPQTKADGYLLGGWSAMPAGQ